MSLEIRIATAEDSAMILSFIKGLAEYERLSHEVEATEQSIRDSLFCPNPGAEVILAFDNGEPVGFALYFHNFSTFLGKRGIYLEDLFVNPEARGKGIGKALLSKLASIAVERGCGRLEWAVLDWNTPAIEFYKRLGAVPMDEWTVFRVAGDSLQGLGNMHKA